MARNLEEKSPDIIENIVKESLKIVGIDEVTEGKVKLLTRLILSGISYYYFHNPDSIIKIGFMQIGKTPDKEELFRIRILRDRQTGILNAESLWKYYKGELHQEAKFKEILNGFLEGLINYSQEQELNITQLTGKLQKRKGEN